MNENEIIREKNRRASQKAFENLEAALKGVKQIGAAQSILKFFRINEKIDEEKPLAEQLKYMMQVLGISLCRFSCTGEWYKSVSMPMLVKMKDGNWAAIIPRFNGRGAYVKDGKRRRITEKNADMFTDYAMCFYRTFKNDKLSAGSLFKFMADCTTNTDRVVIMVVSLIAALSGMILPWANSFIYGRVIPAGQFSQLVPAASLMLAAVGIGSVLKLFQSLVLENCAIRMNSCIQGGIIDRLLLLKPKFFKEIKAGELSSTLMQISAMSDIFSSRSIASLIGLVMSVVYLVQIKIYGGELFGWVLILTVLMLLMALLRSIWGARWQKRYSEALAKISGFCYELFSGIEQVKLSGAEERFFSRWSEYYRDTSAAEEKPFLLRYASVFENIISIIGMAGIFLAGSRLAPSDYIAFSTAYGAYMAAINRAGDIATMICEYLCTYKLAENILTGECEDYGVSKNSPSELRGEISISGLSFGYDKNAEPVLKDLSLHIQSGQSVAVVGGSGCGKSTLLRLILGFETADSGSVYIDDFDIRELDLQAYRKKLGVVLQNSSLIAGDIYANITMIKPDASIDEVWEAVEAAGLEDDIEDLPLGLHTPISEDNCTLSGGQRQRIFIARAILSKPSVLIFDEATSALDNKTQQLITDSVNKLDCTKIFVAHRLSTIKDCDVIYVMDKGRLAESGSFDELMAKHGLFYELASKQLA